MRSSAQNNSNKEGDANICRICLSENWTKENPLISPCNCNGTMKYIHLKCLSEW
jgi:E3 ubiquitin-protein ligase DOA10